MATERLMVAKNERKIGMVYFEHLARYQFARQFCKSALVLDAACGSGYGSFRISNAKNRVIGIDFSREAITFSRKNYNRKGLLYVIMDIQKMAFKSERFNTIISFETIEHIKYPSGFLTEIHRVLNTKGKLIISTPNKGSYNKTFVGDNIYHLNEMNVDEFLNELSAAFKMEGLYGQKYYQDTEAIASAEKNSRNNQRPAFAIGQFLMKTLFKFYFIYSILLKLSNRVKRYRVLEYNKTESFAYIIAVCTKR